MKGWDGDNSGLLLGSTVILTTIVSHESMSRSTLSSGKMDDKNIRETAHFNPIRTAGKRLLQSLITFLNFIY